MFLEQAEDCFEKVNQAPQPGHIRGAGAVFLPFVAPECEETVLRRSERRPVLIQLIFDSLERTQEGYRPNYSGL